MLDEEKVLVKVDRGEREESSEATEWADELKTVIWSQFCSHARTQQNRGGAGNRGEASTACTSAHICHTQSQRVRSPRAAATRSRTRNSCIFQPIDRGFAEHGCSLLLLCPAVLHKHNPGLPAHANVASIKGAVR